MADLSQKDWTKKLKEDNNAVVLDVRTALEVEEGIIPGALHIDIYRGEGFVEDIQKLDTTKNYYVYCRSGGRSSQACAVMHQLGFKNAYNLLGGFSEWQGEVAQIN
ncbi:rhodanese-like domain-containing protein [uncultured Winogradskyella sp.]|uniref:rhodanese-like domain-containing protein n=1 Tax=uncultured Winogradskyella sp. TaxID=395353 RepID=UPI00260DAF31|nr:rhodanese-like domain-containing protein [uncultured Winogradskyella sp.]